MQPIEITQFVNGEPKSVVMPPLRSAAGREAPTLVPGPDIIVGELPSLEQFGSAGTRLASRWEQIHATTATSRSIGFHCQTTITQSFRKIFIE